MSTVLILMLVGMFTLMGLSLPVSFSIGVSAIVALVVKGGIPLAMVPQKMFGAMNSFLMLSIPLYIVVGDLMVEGKISERLVKFANCLVGWMKGSMVFVTFTTAAFFGAISGSAAATTYAIGGMMYPEMVKVKYNPPFAAACSAACGTLGVLIPPSVPLLVFGAITGTSVASLFAYGAIGGVTVMICYMIGGRLELAYSKTDVKTTAIPSRHEFWLAFKEAFPGLLAPAIILGGIYGGIFTATEAGVVAVIYVTFIGLFIYKDLTLEKIVRALIKSGISTACILLIVSCASVFSWLSTIEGLARIMAELVTRVGLTKLSFMTFIMIIYLILGMLMDTLPVIILTAPIFVPIAVMLGIDKVYLGVATVVIMAYGMLTPPFGANIFISSGFTGQPVASILKYSRFLYIFGLVAVFLIVYVPYVLYYR